MKIPKSVFGIVLITNHLAGCDVNTDSNCQDNCKSKPQKTYNSYLENDASATKYGLDYGKAPENFNGYFKLDYKKKIERNSSDFDIKSLDHPDDFFNLAKAYFHEKKITQAIENLQLSALYGHSTAQNDLGRRYENGDGVKIDYKRAYLYYYLSTFQHEGMYHDNVIKNKKINFSRIKDKFSSFLSKKDFDWIEFEIQRHNEKYRSYVSNYKER